MHITKWNKSIWKNYILTDSKYMTFWKIHWDSETTELGKKKKRWVFRGRDKGWTSEHKGVLGQRKFSG